MLVRRLIGLLIVLLIVFISYKVFFSQLQSTGSGSPARAVDVVGVEERSARNRAGRAHLPGRTQFLRDARTSSPPAGDGVVEIRPRRLHLRNRNIRRQLSRRRSLSRRHQSRLHELRHRQNDGSSAVP